MMQRREIASVYAVYMMPTSGMVVSVPSAFARRHGIDLATEGHDEIRHRLVDIKTRRLGTQGHVLSQAVNSQTF